MDAEATTVRNGHPTGLSWYGAHARPELKGKFPTECEWTKRLSALLCELSRGSRAECAYPGDSGEKCDIVVIPAEGARLWLEVKGAWKQWSIENGYRSTYRAHLLARESKGRSHTALTDLAKLNAITREHGTHIGLLLIGFDGAESMHDDVDEFVVLAGLDEPVWCEWSDSWPDSRRPGQSVRCWLWIRQIAE